MGITIYVRYRQIQEIGLRHSDVHRAVERINGPAFWVGMGSCLGVSIVGNFQETNVRPVHYVGAFLAFGMGTIYYWMQVGGNAILKVGVRSKILNLQAYISYYLQPYIGSLMKAHVRLAISVVCTIFFIVVAVTGIISHILFNGTDPRKWYPSDGGWEYHVASSISEWIVATAFCFYILTFTDEFRVMQLDHPPVSAPTLLQILSNTLLQ